MTNNKTYFNQWLKRSNVGEVVNNFPRLPLVEVKVDGEHIKRGYKALDPRYIMCISGKPGTMTDGSVSSGLALINQLNAESTLLIFFVNSKDEALKVLNDPVMTPTTNHSSRLGSGTTAPTSINAFKAWCSRNSVDLILCQRMAHFDPASVGIKAPQHDYYWCEFDSGTLASELLLDRVPHKVEIRDGKRIAIVLAKAGGQYKPKKQLLIEKALTAAQLNRDEKSARFYTELFLQQKVAKVNLENINWNAPDLGMQLVNAAVPTAVQMVPMAAQLTVQEESNDTEDITVPAVTSLDF